MKWSARVSCMMWTSALLLPLAAAPESRLDPHAGRHAAVSARVDFKVVIPLVLSMEMHAQQAAIGGNGRTMALAATVRGADSPRRDLILGMAASSKAPQEALCAMGAANIAWASVPSGARMICTVSMP